VGCAPGKYPPFKMGRGRNPPFFMWPPRKGGRSPDPFQFPVNPPFADFPLGKKRTFPRNILARTHPSAFFPPFYILTERSIGIGLLKGVKKRGFKEYPRIIRKPLYGTPKFLIPFKELAQILEPKCPNLK